MAGVGDGVVDALNAVSRPVTGGLYWCPPRVDGSDTSALDLRVLHL